MPDIKRSYQIAMALRRLPLIHRPLKWLRRSAWQQVVDLTVETARVLAPMSPQLGPPKGAFSIYEALRRGEPGLEGRILLEAQSGQVVPDKSLQVLCRLKQHLEQPRPVFWSRHREARLVTSSLALLNEKKQIAVESVYGRQFLRYQPGYRYFRLPRPRHLPGNWTSIVSSWVPTSGVPPFSHWLLDALPRLATLEEFPEDTKIIIPKVLAPYQKETLALLGLSERIRYTEEEHLIVENYYFSSPTTMISCYNPHGVNFLRTTFLPKADASYSGPKRFIIQRKGKSRGIKNEAEVNKFFQERGWGIIDTEKLGFAQEVKLFSQAEAIAGILGSGFTNAVWCSPGCVIITFVADSWLDGWVEWIAGVCNLPYHYQIFPSDDAMMAHVDVNEVGKLLKAAGLE